MPIIVCVAFALAFSVCAALYSVRYYQILQLGSYNGKKLLSFCLNRGFYTLIVGVVIVAAAFVSEIFGIKSLIFCPVVALFGYFVLYRMPCTVKMKLTKRMWRLISAVTALNFVISTALVYFGLPAAAYILLPLAPVVVSLTNAVMMLVEKAVSDSYIKKAEQKLSAINPIKIAITGSYGKTTAKNILAAMLAKKYRVCISPLSYNTPAGLSVAINNNLMACDQIFVAEMGARRRGDIEFLAKMVKPDIAVITAVGTQHLETFGSRENVMLAKRELIDNMSDSGKAFFNGDNDFVKTMYDKFAGNKTLCGKNGSVRWSNAVFSPGETKFDLIAHGEKISVATSLAGAHIPSMICLCAAVALSLKVPLADIKSAISSLQPVAHRLQMLYNGSDVIIDDSFSSNEEGFKSAVGVLGQFNYLIKVIITPGVVELGSAQYAINYELGAVAGKVCDYLIAVGANAEALVKGATGAGLPKRSAVMVKSRAEAMERYTKIKGGKAVLFENDLPDNYG